MKQKISLRKIYSLVGSQIVQNTRTGNIVGEFAEELMADYYKGTPAPVSQKGYDFDANGKRYQVKARLAKGKRVTGNLSDIHFWDFDFLIVVFFDANGLITLAKEISVEEAKKIAIKNGTRHIISSSSVRKITNCKDITNSVKITYNL